MNTRHWLLVIAILCAFVVSFLVFAQSGSSAQTQLPTQITFASAKLNGLVNPNEKDTYIQFEYAISETTPTYAATNWQSIGSGTDFVPVSDTVLALAENTLYTYRIVISNTETAPITTTGNNLTFTTKPSPVRTTQAAASITTNAAKLNASVNPKASPVNVYFEYGQTESYGSASPARYLGSGSSALTVRAFISALSPGTFYNFRIVVATIYGTGTVYGTNLTFWTAGLRPAPTCILPAAPSTNTSTSSAQLQLTANPNGLATTVYFRHRKDGVAEWTTTSVYIGSGATPISATAKLTNLEPNKLYHFKFDVTNSTGTTTEDGLTFNTVELPPAPTCATTAADIITNNSARLNATVNPNTLPTTVYFEYGISTTPPTYPNSTTAQYIGSGITPLTIRANISGLSPGSTYNFRAVATNSTGTTDGNNMGFNSLVPSSLAFVYQPGDTTAGATMSALTVRVTDDADYTVAGTAVSVTTTNGTLLNGTLTRISDADGIATFSGLNMTLAGGYTLSATALSDVISTTSTSFNITPAVAVKVLWVTQPTTPQTAGTNWSSFTAEVTDQYNNRRTSDNTTVVSVVTVTGTTGFASGASVTVSSGLATFSASLYNKAETITVKATASGLTDSTTTGSIVVNPGAATKVLWVTQPTTPQTAGANWATCTAELTDANNNRRTSDNTTVVSVVTVTGTTGFASGYTATVSSGLATFSAAKYNKAETVTVKATASGLTDSTTTGSIVVNPGAVTNLVFVDQPTNTTAGQIINPNPPYVTVRLRDQFGNNVLQSGVSVNMIVKNGPPPVLYGTAPRTTDANGIATYNDLSIQIAGTSYRLRASLP